MNTQNEIEWEVVDFDFCDEEKLGPESKDTPVESNDPQVESNETKEIEKTVEDEMMEIPYQIASTLNLTDEIESCEIKSLKAPFQHAIFSKSMNEKQVRWERTHKRYALAYDSNGNEIVVRKINHGTQLAYWSENKQVQVFENKEKTSFTCRDGSSFSRKKPENIENAVFSS